MAERVIGVRCRLCEELLTEHNRSNVPPGYHPECFEAWASYANLGQGTWGMWRYDI